MHEESRNAIVIAILTLEAVFWIGIIVLTIGRDGMILLAHFPLVGVMEYLRYFSSASTMNECYT